MAALRSEAHRLLGRRIRDIREEQRITRRDTADLAGINETNLGKIERGEGNPTFEMLLKLSGVLATTPSSLLDGISAALLPESERPLTAREWVAEKQRHNGGER